MNFQEATERLYTLYKDIDSSRSQWSNTKEQARILAIYQQIQGILSRAEIDLKTGNARGIVAPFKPKPVEPEKVEVMSAKEENQNLVLADNSEAGKRKARTKKAKNDANGND